MSFKWKKYCFYFSSTVLVVVVVVLVDDDDDDDDDVSFFNIPLCFLKEYLTNHLAD